MKLSKKQMQAIRQFVEDDENVVENYSPPMFGKECLGIITPGNPLTFFGYLIHTLSGKFPDLVEKLCDNVRTDSMGNDRILYFPDIQWDNEIEENGEENN